MMQWILVEYRGYHFVQYNTVVIMLVIGTEEYCSCTLI